MKTFLIVFLLCSFSLRAQTNEARTEHYNLDDNLALEGYDPVSYFAGKPAEGSKAFSYSYRGVTYKFANETNQNLFKQSPANYEPAYGGWCAYAMSESGEKVKIDPETYKIINNKLYLFYNFWGNNTLKDWNKNESNLKSAADDHWKKYLNE